MTLNFTCLYSYVKRWSLDLNMQVYYSVVLNLNLMLRHFAVIGIRGVIILPVKCTNKTIIIKNQ